MYFFKKEYLPILPAKLVRKMSKIKFELEIPVHASPRMLYQYFSTPSGLEEWFADKVNSRGKLITFFWDDSEEEATIVSKKNLERVRYKWTESDEDDSYFEFKIDVDPLTKSVTVIITDFADDEEAVDEAKMLWESQIDSLKSSIGA